MGRGAWHATVHGAAKESDTTEQLNSNDTTQQQQHNCFTMLYSFVLFNSMSQLYVCPLPPAPRSHPIPIPPLWVTTEHRAAFPVLYSHFPLAVSRMVVRMTTPLSQFLPPSPPPSVSTSVTFRMREVFSCSQADRKEGQSPSG